MERLKLIKVAIAGAALVVAAGTLLYHFTRPAPGTVLNAGESTPVAEKAATSSPPKSGKSGYTRPEAERQGGGYLAPGGR